MMLEKQNRTETETTPSIHILEFAEKDAGRWNAFVRSCAEATFFHLFGWKEVVEQAFHHKTYYLVAECEETILGVLPLGHIQSRVFGNALISVPFCVYGGVAACDEKARFALEGAAESMAARLGVDYLELRNRQRRREGWHTKELYVTFRRHMHANSEENLKAIPRKQRAMVRKGIKAGLRGIVDDDVDRFYYAYSSSVRNLGTPVLRKKYFRLLLEAFGEDCEILTVTKDDRTVSSVLSFFFRDEVLPYYGGGTREARALKANDFMYWEVMRRASEKGVRVFDYGRSKKGTGSYQFKKNWGFEPEPLPYQYRLVKARDIPNVSPANPRYKLFIEAWKHLPLPVANAVGPLISRNFA